MWNFSWKVSFACAESIECRIGGLGGVPRVVPNTEVRARLGYCILSGKALTGAASSSLFCLAEHLQRYERHSKDDVVVYGLLSLSLIRCGN